MPGDDSQAAEIERALSGMFGHLEEARLRLVAVLGNGPLLRDHPYLRAHLTDYGRQIGAIQRGLGDLRRMVGAPQGERAMNGATS